MILFEMQTQHQVSAAGLATAAAHHLAAGGDRAGYWHLLAVAQRYSGCQGWEQAYDSFMSLSHRYSTGEISFPEACTQPL